MKPMTNEDIRALRKRMGLQHVEFAGLLGVGKQTSLNLQNPDKGIRRVYDLACRYLELKNFGGPPRETMTLKDWAELRDIRDRISTLLHAAPQDEEQ